MPGRRGGLASVQQTAVVFAGSRRGTISSDLSSRLVEVFRQSDCRFLVCCTTGIDACFRTILREMSASKTAVLCASQSRVRSARASGFEAVYTPSSGYSVTAGIHVRAVSVVSRSSILILFPDDPKHGSWDYVTQLIFNAAIQQHRSLFVSTDSPPVSTAQVRIVPGSLFGIVSGYWAIPLGVIPSDSPDESLP